MRAAADACGGDPWAWGINFPPRVERSPSRGVAIGRLPGRGVEIGRERLRQLLVAHDITFQRTKTWDVERVQRSARDAKLDRIDHVLAHHPDRVFAFDEFGPLVIRPVGGSCWAVAGKPQRQPAN